MGVGLGRDILVLLIGCVLCSNVRFYRLIGLFGETLSIFQSTRCVIGAPLKPPSRAIASHGHLPEDQIATLKDIGSPLETTLLSMGSMDLAMARLPCHSPRSKLDARSEVSLRLITWWSVRRFRLIKSTSMLLAAQPMTSKPVSGNNCSSLSEGVEWSVERLAIRVRTFEW